MIITDLKKRLSVEILPVYFLKGRDAYLRDFAVKIFKELTDPDYADFNVQTFEDAENIKDIIIALNTAPVFSDKRLVFVKSAANLDEGDKSRLETYFKNPSDFSVLIFADDGAADIGRDGGLSGMYSYGDVVDCNGVNETQLSEWVRADAEKAGAEINAAAVKLLAQYTNCNMTRAMTELKKLYVYAEGRPITAEFVELLVSPDIEYKTYALTNALTNGNNTEALKILQSLLERGESASGLLAMLTSQYRRMLEAKISRLEPNALARIMNVKLNSIMIARELALKYTPVELKAITDKLHSLEYAFKSGRKEENAALHEAFSVLLKKR